MRDDQLATQKREAEIQEPSYKCVPISDDLAIQICGLTALERARYKVSEDYTHLELRVEYEGIKPLIVDEEILRNSIESYEVVARNTLHRDKTYFYKPTHNTSNNATNLSDDELRALGFDLPEVRVSTNTAGLFSSSNPQLSAADAAKVTSSAPAAINP